jgi:hypothetical protein
LLHTTLIANAMALATLSLFVTRHPYSPSPLLPLPSLLLPSTLFDQISHYHYYYNTTNGSKVASFPSPPTDKQQIKLHTHLCHPFKGFLIKFPPQYRSPPSFFFPTTTESRTTEIVTPSLVHLSLNFRATQ